MTQPDRPARTRPRPAADAGVDPIDYRPTETSAPVTAPPSVEGKGAAAPAAAPAPDAATGTRVTAPVVALPSAGGAEVTVQLATRISLEVAAVLDAAIAREKAKRGSKASKRSLIEEAIMRTFGG